MIEELTQVQIRPTLGELSELAKRGNLTALVAERPSDLETPVSVFLKLDTGSHTFLLESVEQGERTGRYSFVGLEPSATVAIRDGQALIVARGRTEMQQLQSDNPLSVVKDWLKDIRTVLPNDMPAFVGGAVGYVGYDMARHFEPRLQRTARPATPFDPP